jgi:hypothetical protein
MKISFRYFNILVLLFASIIYVYGCASWPKQSQSASGQPAQPVEKSLAVASVLRFDDLPVPSGFKLIPKESVAFQNNSSRFAFLKYTGKSNPEPLILFFKEQMPLYNWEMVNLIEHGAKVMNFEKADENCTVSIEGSGSKTIVMISLTPRAPRSRK